MKAKHSITIDDRTWRRLESLRRRLGLRSVAETIRYLVMEVENRRLHEKY